MKTFKVLAERIVVEETEVQADTPEQAIEIAKHLDDDAWEPSHDANFLVTSAIEQSE